MRRLTTFARYLAPGVLVVCVMSAGAPCAAQENADAPTLPAAPGAGDGRGTLFAPSGWAVLSVPVQKQIDLKLYGFYIGDLEVPGRTSGPADSAGEVPDGDSQLYGLLGSRKRAQRARAAAGGIHRQLQGAPVPNRRDRGVRRSQVRDLRSQHVCPAVSCSRDDTNRYRGRIAIAHPLAVRGRIWKPFASYETFYEQTAGWNRERIWTGVTLPLNKRVFVQPSYMWETSEGSRSVDYLLVGLIVNTR